MPAAIISLGYGYVCIWVISLRFGEFEAFVASAFFTTPSSHGSVVTVGTIASIGCALTVLTHVHTRLILHILDVTYCASLLAGLFHLIRHLAVGGEWIDAASTALWFGLVPVLIIAPAAAVISWFVSIALQNRFE